MKIGFIGLGNMASALIGGIIKNQIIEPDQIIGADVFESAREHAKDQFKIHVSTDNKEVVKQSEILVLAVKPQFYPIVLEEIKQVVGTEQLIISIAPGKTIEWLSGYLGTSQKIVRCMPNTPALVGEGCTGICHSETVSKEELEAVTAIINSIGRTYPVTEHQMDAVVAVSGSSPAYVFMLIEAMADAAVLEGLPRKTAYEMAAQAVLGSAKMVLETGKHPADLKDMVCSPAGTTIEAVKILERQGFRSCVIEAMGACADKSRSL